MKLICCFCSIIVKINSNNSNLKQPLLTNSNFLGPIEGVAPPPPPPPPPPPLPIGIVKKEPLSEPEVRMVEKEPLSENLPENTNSGLNVPMSMSDAILKVQLKSVNQDDIQPRKIGMIKKNLVKSSLLVFCFRNCSDTFSENIFEIGDH